MRKLITILPLLLLFSCIKAQFFGIASNTATGSRVTNITWSGKTVDIIGDSYTVGYPVTTPQRWTTIFCAGVGATENNLGLNGRGIETDPGCAGYSALTNATIPTHIANHKLIIALGTNDLARDATTFNPTTFKTDLTARVANALSKGHAPDDIILFNTYNLWDWSAFTTSCGTGTKNTTLINQFNTAIQEVANENGLWYFDVYTEMAGFLITDYQADHTHLSVAGYDKLAQIVINRLGLEWFVLIVLIPTMIRKKGRIIPINKYSKAA